MNKNRDLIFAVLLVVMVLLGGGWLYTQMRRSGTVKEGAHEGPGGNLDPRLNRGQMPAPEHFAGVGVVAGLHNGAIEIMQVLPNSPAAKAGLSPGLRLVKIDGVPTEGKPLKECVDMVRGVEGTKVNLELIDPANGTTNAVELTRENITLPSSSVTKP